MYDHSTFLYPSEFTYMTLKPAKDVLRQQV